MTDDAFTVFAASGRPAIVFVVHGWGGGIRRHVDDLAALAASRVNVVLLEPAAGDTVRLRAHGAGRCARQAAQPGSGGSPQ